MVYPESAFCRSDLLALTGCLVALTSGLASVLKTRKTPFSLIFFSSKPRNSLSLPPWPLHKSSHNFHISHPLNDPRLVPWSLRQGESVPPRNRSESPYFKLGFLGFRPSFEFGYKSWGRGMISTLSSHICVMFCKYSYLDTDFSLFSISPSYLGLVLH